MNQMNHKSGIASKADNMRIFASVLGVGLALVSTVFTVKLMITFGNSGFEKCLYAVFGALIQSAQTALYVYSAYCLWVIREPGKALPGFVLFCLLFCLSLAGSIGSFVVSNRSQNVVIEKTEKVKETYDTELAAVNKDAESTNKQLEALKAKGVVTKAKGTEEKAAAITEKRSTLFEGKRAVIAAESADDPDALYKIIGEFFGIAPNAAKMLLFTLYAIALELASVILLSYSMILKGDTAETHGTLEDAANAPMKADVDVYLDQKQRQQRSPAFSFGNLDVPPLGAAMAYAERKSPVPEYRTPEQEIREYTPDVRPPVVPVPESESGKPEKKVGFLTTDGDKPLKQKPAVENQLEGIEAYIEKLFESQKSDGSLTGQWKAAQLMGISKEEANKFHAALKSLKLITVRNSSTYPIVDKEAMLTAVKSG